MNISFIKKLLPLFAVSTLLTACQNRTMSETTVDLVHSVMGGEISKLRPPAPGFDKPYPYLNQTPKTNPEFPSKDARNALTDTLEKQRNYAQRLSLATGKMPDTQNTSSNFSVAPLTADALNETEINKNHAQIETIQNSKTASAPSPDSPKVIYLPFNHPFPNTLPDVGSAPQPPMSFQGFHIPTLHEALHPNFDTATPTGTLIRFEEESDHLISGQDKTLAEILHNRKKHVLVLSAFGTGVNNHEGLEPEEQNHALTLALLRAHTLAHYFLQHGVPASFILIKANVLGDGVRITYQ